MLSAAAARLGVVVAFMLLAASHVHARGRDHVGDSTPFVLRRGEAASKDVGPPLELHPLVAEAERHLGEGNFTGLPGAWCAWAVSAWLRATGHRPLASGLAASAFAYGPCLAQPEPGALAVTWRHVGIVEAVNSDGTVTTISGNWGHRVRRARLARAGLVFVRV